MRQPSLVARHHENQGLGLLTETECSQSTITPLMPRGRLWPNMRPSKNPVFRYLLESKRGKSRALNAGIREARGEIIALNDDNCIPSTSWVASIIVERDFHGNGFLRHCASGRRPTSDVNQAYTDTIDNCKFRFREWCNVANSPFALRPQLLTRWSRHEGLSHTLHL